MTLLHPGKHAGLFCVVFDGAALGTPTASFSPARRTWLNSCCMVCVLSDLRVAGTSDCSTPQDTWIYNHISVRLIVFRYETPGFKMFLTSAMATNTMLYIGFRWRVTCDLWLVTCDVWYTTWSSILFNTHHPLFQLYWRLPEWIPRRSPQDAAPTATPSSSIQNGKQWHVHCNQHLSLNLSSRS